MCGQSYDDPSFYDTFIDPPTCDGVTRVYRVRSNGWGWEAVPCNVRTGLSTFTDYQGETRRACRWHRASVERRFGVREPEPEWLVTS